jgi:hypothetical protein
MKDTSPKQATEQVCVNLEAFIFDFAYYQSLKNMEVVFFFEWRLSFVMWWSISVDDVMRHECEYSVEPGVP